MSKNLLGDVISVGRQSPHVTTRDMEQCCATNDVDLLHIRQISKPESLLKSFHCVFKFVDEKAESPGYWPKNVSFKILSKQYCTGKINQN